MASATSYTDSMAFVATSTYASPLSKTIVSRRKKRSNRLKSVNLRAKKRHGRGGGSYAGRRMLLVHGGNLHRTEGSRKCRIWLLRRACRKADVRPSLRRGDGTRGSGPAHLQTFGNLLPRTAPRLLHAARPHDS